ncbi:GGDEF domain-containing protein [Plesiomonas shigelloides]|uniref:GGDEF domain-containing protein n=1 Tax=Plesiomonas shigelloides TaxID=703 RepID=UPI0014037CF2|nr:GGDEF domain-containing protein [Plesiomonas shigelloides]
MVWQNAAAKFFTALLLLTVAAVVLYPVFAHRVIRIDGLSADSVEPIDDRVRGGTSEAVVTVDKNGRVNLNCQLTTDYRWPYCEASLLVAEPELGLDLSKFERIRIALRSSGEEPQFWRLYLRNYDPAYSRCDEPLSHKVNELIVRPADTGNMVDVPMRAFQVASWWINDFKVPVQQALPQFDRVFQLEFASSEVMPAGEHRLQIDYVEFHGKWISPEHYYLLIIAVWVVSMLTYLSLMHVQMRAQLRSARQRQQQLSELNLMLKLRNEEVEYQAKYDPLTGALNRYGARALMLDMWRPTKAETEGAMILLDIDHFKRINDTYGHLVGDEVLQHLAHRCRSLIPANCRLVRWGGEEFMLLCPDMTLYRAQYVAEQLRSEFEQTIWPLNIAVTASFGVVELGVGENMADTICRADVALYQAKQNGRNCVCLG